MRGAEDRAEQLGGAICDLRLGGEAGGGGDEHHGLEDTGHVVEAAGLVGDSGQRVQGRDLGGLGTLGEFDGVAETARGDELPVA